MHLLAEPHKTEGDRDLYEICLADGMWMLVREDDIVAGTIGQSPIRSNRDSSRGI
ncbi:MAG: hypothetical protein ACRDP2_00010 [Nocardioidaceae bacterium]